MKVQLNRNQFQRYSSQIMSATLIRYKSMFLAFILGLLMAISSFSVIRYYEYQQLEQQFNATFVDKLTGLTQAVNAIEKVLIASQQMLVIKPSLTQKEFQLLVSEALLSGTSVKGIEWAPAVALAEVEQFQKNIQQTGVFDFLVRKDSGQQHCTLQQNTVYPIVFAEPSNELGHELGLDISSSCSLFESMQIAAEQDIISSSQFVTEGEQVGVHLLLPVKRNHSLIGFVVGQVMINELVDSLWGDLTKSTAHRLTILDNSANKNLLYDSYWQLGCENGACHHDDFEFIKTMDIPFANQLWTIAFTQNKTQAKEDYYSYLAAFLVLLATATLSYYLYKNINRIQWANKLVEERTASLKFQATHDQLTSLLNKPSLFRQLKQLVEPESTFTAFSILFIDLDHFKKINDTMGHLVGDKILKLASRRIKSQSRKGDSLFRFGGDEFVIILKGLVDEERVINVAERYLEELKMPYLIQGQNYNVSASIGVSIIGNNNTNAEEILRNADIAMYRAKDAGRGQVISFRDKMYDMVVKEHMLESDLEKAVKLDEFELYYQPIIGRNQQLSGFEALVRWRHKTKGLIMPLDFVPLIEKSNLIKPFGELVADKALSKLRELLVMGYIEKCPYISINISPLQLLDDSIVRYLSQKLQQYNLPPHLLAIELTESALIENHELVKNHLTQLSQLGIKIFMDDFGTGYSSLSLLQHFPIDTLKIDRSFILALSTQTQESENLVKAIIRMAQALNMSVVAEGIEYKELMNLLSEFGCDAFQGYYFSKPMPAEQVYSYAFDTPTPTLSEDYRQQPVFV